MSWVRIPSLTPEKYEVEGGYQLARPVLRVQAGIGAQGLPGCPPRPEMLLDSIVKLHDKIQNMKLGVNRERQITELEQARLESS
jgi:Ni,Fe-hydrogenase III small subunit